MNYKEFSEKYKKIPQKAEIILIFSLSSIIMLFVFALNKGDNGILGGFINLIFKYLPIIKYLICIVPFELGIQFYKKYFYKYMYQKQYRFKLPLMACISILVFSLMKLPFKVLKRSMGLKTHLNANRKERSVLNAK